MNPLIPLALATSDLPYAGQKTLINATYYQFRARLIASPTTHIDIINTLLEKGRGSQGADVFLQALVRTTNLERIKESLKNRLHYERASLLRNPLMPVDTLVETLGIGAIEALLAYINPSTPEEAKRHLTPERACNLIESGGNRIVDRKLRAFALVSANLWMMETPMIWNKYIQEAIAAQPAAGGETLHALRAGKTLRRVLTSHPAYNGDDINALSVTELLATGSGAAFVSAITRPEFTAQDAGQIFGKYNPETQVIGLLINRFGLGTLYTSRWNDIEHYKPAAAIRAATWMAPAAADYQHDQEQEHLESAAICKILGNHQNRWETFVALLPNWHGSNIDAAKTACKL